MLWVPPTTRNKISPGTRNVENGESASIDFGIESPSATTMPIPPPTADSALNSDTPINARYATVRTFPVSMLGSSRSVPIS